YSYHVSGQMKSFLDHFANMWVVHRPETKMFSKQGIVIATAAGPVYKKSKKAARKIQTKFKKTKPCFRVKKWFYFSRFMQKYIGNNPPDVVYWEE
ncbi:MAG: hypothetical protein RR444_01275, partial [Oscillospiraceae bacterium]